MNRYSICDASVLFQFSFYPPLRRLLYAVVNFLVNLRKFGREKVFRKKSNSQSNQIAFLLFHLPDHCVCCPSQSLLLSQGTNMAEILMSRRTHRPEIDFPNHEHKSTILLVNYAFQFELFAERTPNCHLFLLD